MMRLVAILVLSFFAAHAAAEQLLSKRTFTRQFAEALRAEAPGAQVVVKGELELTLKDGSENEINLFLDNAYATYSADPAARKEVIQRYIRSALETRASDGKAIDRSRIVPVVKDVGWLAETREAAKASGARKAAENVYEAFTAELVIVYAEDTPRNIRYLTADEIARLGVKKEELRALAVANLRNLIARMELHTGPQVSMITAGGDYEASLLLFDDLWSGGKLQVEGEIVVAIPARDMLLFTGSKQRGGVAKLRQMTAAISSKASYRLTDRLFVYRGGRFQSYE
jgi:uncharacterized protein YtpQ (UPF0354 family)